MYFERDGIYEYDASRIKDAHAWCQQMTREALTEGKKVVVSNTFVRLREIAPYRSMAERLRVVEAKGIWGNVHGFRKPQFRKCLSDGKCCKSMPSQQSWCICRAAIAIGGYCRF